MEYSFKCSECGDEYDVDISMSKISEYVPPKCECGGKINRVYYPPYVHTKGRREITDEGVTEHNEKGVDLGGFETIHDKTVGEVEK